MKTKHEIVAELAETVGVATVEGPIPLQQDRPAAEF